MRRSIAIVAATVALLLGAGITAMALAHSDDDPGPGRHMSASGWSGGGTGPQRGTGSWMHGSGPGAYGPMYDGMYGPWMHATVRVDDEAGYLSEMVAHHREAVVAAGELSRSERPAMRAFGRKVVAVQTAQIALMEGWLAEWYPDEPEASYEPMMRDLSGLSGDALDRAFLADMIPHHMAAVMMSQQLLMRGLDEHVEVQDLARTIRDDQMDEIVWMRVMWSRMAR
jgi:uncharacterized protein (DUF305 family)